MILNYTPAEEYEDGSTVRETAQGDLWGGYTRALVAAGVVVGGNALHPSSTATTVRLKGGAREVQDGA